MTDDELHDAIASDPDAKALADAGNDAGCAARMRALLPPGVVSTRLGEGAILLALGDEDGDAALAAIEATTQAEFPEGDPRRPLPGILARIVRIIQKEGVDFGEPSVRAKLDMLHAAGILTESAVATLKAVAETPARVSADDVSRAWAQYRPGGIVGGTD